jgi:hypothetical protein
MGILIVIRPCLTITSGHHWGDLEELGRSSIISGPDGELYEGLSELREPVGKKYLWSRLWVRLANVRRPPCAHQQRIFFFPVHEKREVTAMNGLNREDTTPNSTLTSASRNETWCLRICISAVR